jgi:hypothetical protein
MVTKRDEKICESHVYLYNTAFPTIHTCLRLRRQQRPIKSTETQEELAIKLKKKENCLKIYKLIALEIMVKFIRDYGVGGSMEIDE